MVTTRTWQFFPKATCSSRHACLALRSNGPSFDGHRACTCLASLGFCTLHMNNFDLEISGVR